MSESMLSPEEVAQEVKRLAMQLQQAGRKDLLLHAHWRALAGGTQD